MPEKSIRPDWVPVTIRLKVPATTIEDQVFDCTKDWDRRLQPYLTFDRECRPVPLSPPRAERKEFRESGTQLVVVRAWVDPKLLTDPELIGLVKAQPHCHNIARDVRLEPFEGRGREAEELSFAPGGAAPRVECAGSDRGFGTAADVARALGVTRIWAAGYTGRGLVVGVVDGGITARGRLTQPSAWPAIPEPPAEGEVIGGYPPADWGTTAEGWGAHGNMIAFDVQAMAPEAELWDIRIWEPGVAFPAYVSNAVLGYRLAIDHYRTHGVPQILVNSWGLYDSANGPDYAFDPYSEIALAVEEALDAGVLILFAAGNCGDGCPFAAGSLCGYGNRGPGASILGPNGHPEVMTVGAATLRGEWCGYTSQGPAILPPNDPDKPDFCSISQFDGFFPNHSGLRPYDGGTSAATGIAAGVVALLKQARPDLTQEECRRLLRETARPIRTPAAHDGAGAGIIDALRAFRSL